MKRLLLLGCLVATTAGWVMHNRLTRSLPEKDATLASPPSEIRLWFAQKPTPALSSIILQAADSTKVALGKLAKTDDPLSIQAAIPSRLGAGRYRVSWKTSGDDGHVIRGSFTFSIR